MRSNNPSYPTEQVKKHRSRGLRIRLKLNNPVEWLLALAGVGLMIYGLSTLWSQMTMLKSDWSPDTVTDAHSLGIKVSDLLPLADPVNPIAGWHDMANLPDPSQPGRVVPGDQPQPNIDLPVTAYDFGVIPPGPGNVSQTFYLQNIGTEALEISSVTTSCSCTRANLSSSVIPPGTRANLTAIFDPDYHEIEGPVKRAIWLETNDPDQPVVEVSFAADVQ